MKTKNYSAILAILLLNLISSTAVFADVKIKIRRTMSGQTMENTTYIKGKRQRAEQNLSAADLAAAIQNTLGEYLKDTKIELVALEAKLAAAIDAEAAEKQCDFILYATVSHKKGGSGFGFGKMMGQVVGQTGIGHTGIGHTGSTAGNVAGQMATTAIVSAGNMSANVKSKDEITLDINLKQTGGANALFK